MDESYNKQLTDHYIQADIITLLMDEDRPLPFSKIKPDEVENSLFMYHLKKLLDRGIIEKASDGYKISSKGLRWINYLGGMNSNIVIKPLALTQFILTQDNQILLGERGESEAKEFGKYMLPGNRHLYGELSDESVKRVAKLFDIDVEKQKLICVLESIVKNTNDDYTHHSISHLYELEFKNNVEPTALGYYGCSWHPIDSVINDPKTFSQLISYIVGKWHNNELQKIDSILINN